MVSSPIATTSPTSDQAVKDLLDKRSRASYTSVSFSQRSDSPSIYSRGDISPNPLSAPLAELPSRSIIGQLVLNDTGLLPRTLSPADSADDTSYIPTCEDDDDDDGTSLRSASTSRPFLRQDTDPTIDSQSEFESPSKGKAEDDPRMSLLGPKMRFVSRAPWETGEDDLSEDIEEGTGGVVEGLSFFGGKNSCQKEKGQNESSVKGLGLTTFRSQSRSPGAAAAPRKGGIGMNLGLYRHKTLEPAGESPYGSYLPNASQSHGTINASITRSSSDSQSSSNLSVDVPIPRFASGPVSPVSPADERVPSPEERPYRPPQPTSSSRDKSLTSSFPPGSPPQARYVHPYANPDLLPSPRPPPSAPLPETPRQSSSRSSEERDRNLSPLRRSSESSQHSHSTVVQREASANDTGAPASHSRDNGDESSEVDNVSFGEHFQTLMSKDSTIIHASDLGQKDGPMQSLISLEQARARAQNTPRASLSAHDKGLQSTPRSTLIAGLGLAPGVVVDQGLVRNRAQRSATIPFPQSESFSLTRNSDDQRSRTTSSGKHTSGSRTTPRPGDDAPTKALKHKRSAFLKFFQGVKDKERDKETFKESSGFQSPQNSTTTSLPGDSNGQPVRPPPHAFNVKRVPPPMLSVVVTSPSIGSSSSLNNTIQSADEGHNSTFRLPKASLSGNGEEQDPPGEDRRRTLDVRKPTAFLPSTSSSAPPSQTEFKTLSLRPVSTTFSANFQDLLSPSSPSSDKPSPSNQSQTDPSPITPGFDSSRSNSISTTSDYPVTPTSVKPQLGETSFVPSQAEDPYQLIAALQEQIMNSRKAWQRQIWELEGQVQDLKAEIEELRNSGECETCGKTKRDGRIRDPPSQPQSVVHRPRPRTGG